MATGSSSADEGPSGAGFERIYAEASPDYARVPAYRGGTNNDNNSDEEDGERSATSSRLVRILKSLFAVQLAVVRRELATDRNRIVRGVIALGVAALFLSTMLVSLQVAAVCLLHERGLRLSFSVLAVGGADLLVGLLGLLVGRSALRKRILPESRALIQRTLAAFFS